MPPPPAISIRNLTKVFYPGLRSRPVIAVRDLSLDVAPGQVYGLLGPNGSGKSTTLKILLGLIPATSGQTSIFGVDSTRTESRRQVGFLPENPYFYKYLSGHETLRFFGKLCGLSGRELRPRIAELLALVGLEHAAARPLAGYSKGMLQRIGLAQALIHQPRLLVLDEPTAGVDPAGSRDIRDLILRLRSQGITILITSHLLAQVQEICDRVGIIHNGILVREGILSDLISIRSQTELLLENVPPETIERIKSLLADGPGHLVHARQPQTTLETLFLEATKNK